MSPVPYDPMMMFRTRLSGKLIGWAGTPPFEFAQSVVMERGGDADDARLTDHALRWTNYQFLK
jgi:hypothetical protein